jgi:HEAT repeat protein
MADESARERLEAAEEFLRLYPAAEPYSGRVRRQLEALQQAIERAEERRKTYVGLSPQYPEQALRDLRLVVEGEENATVDDIRPFLEHRQKELRALAVRAMAQMDREAGFEAAAAALQDRNEDARLAAVQVLGAYPTEEARALLQRAAEEDLSPRVRAEAREALAD